MWRVPRGVDFPHFTPRRAGLPPVRAHPWPHLLLRVVRLPVPSLSAELALSWLLQMLFVPLATSAILDARAPATPRLLPLGGRQPRIVYVK